MISQHLNIKKIASKYDDLRKNLLPILQDIVKKEKYLSEESMIEVADLLNISYAEVYGVSSFYSFLDIEPRGKNIIRICKTISCDLSGKEKIIKAISNKLKIKVGETTPDNKFSLFLTNCIGWCHKGPAMLINDNVYTELTPEKAIKALEEYL